MTPFNLPDGCSVRDCEGPPMPRCVRCGDEVNEVFEFDLCEDCTKETNERIY